MPPRKIEPLYVTEAECMERIGIDKRHGKDTFVVWERSGFPMIDVEVGKRYWPAVRAWLDRRNGMKYREHPTFRKDGVVRFR